MSGFSGRGEGSDGLEQGGQGARILGFFSDLGAGGLGKRELGSLDAWVLPWFRERTGVSV